ncbi:MAG: O-antigen ligase family protein [Candidatus Omnitrophota bacterium]
MRYLRPEFSRLPLLFILVCGPVLFNNNTSQALFALESLIVFALLIYLCEEKIIFSLTRPNIYLAVYLLICVLSVLWSRYFYGSLQEAIKLFCFGLFFVLVCSFNKTEGALKSTVLYALAGLACVVILNSISIISGIKLFGISGLSTRYQAIFKNANILASFLILGLPLSISIFKGLKKTSLKIILGLFIIAGLFNLMLTYSRAPLLALVISLLFLVYAYRTKYFVWLAAILFLAVAVFFIFGASLTPELNQRLLTADWLIKKSIIPRLHTYKTAIKIFLDSRFLGVGLSNFGWVYFGHLNSPDWQQHAHNIFLENLAENGILGLIFFALAIMAFSSAFLRLRERLKPTDFRFHIILGLSGGLLAVLVHNQLDYTLWSTAVGLYIFLFLGIFCAIYQGLNQDAKKIVVSKKPAILFILIFWLAFILRPFAASMFFKKGVALADRGKIQEAIAYLNKAYRLDRHPIYKASLGSLYAKVAERRGIVEYEKAVLLNPLDASLVNNLAWLYCRQKDFKLAKEGLIKAATLDPFSMFGPHYLDLLDLELETNPRLDNIPPEILKGIIRSGEFGFNAAGCISKKGLSLISKAKGPDNVFLADLYFYSQNFNQALTFYKKALKEKADTYVSIALARCYIKLDKFKEAHDVINQIILTSPGIKEPYILRSIIDEKGGNLDESIKDLAKALLISPLDEESNIRLYLLYKQKCPKDKAEKQLEKVLFLAGGGFYSPISDTQYKLEDKDVLILERSSCRDGIYQLESRISQVLYKRPLVKNYSPHP